MTTEVSPAIRDAGSSGAFPRRRLEDEQVLVTSMSIDEELAAHWDSIIDHKLIEWGRETEAFQVEGLIAPTSEAIGRACELVRAMRYEGWSLPTGVIPDGEGGIVFENRHGAFYQRVEIDEHGGMSFVTFQDATLVSRVPIDVVVR